MRSGCLEGQNVKVTCLALAQLRAKPLAKQQYCEWLDIYVIGQLNLQLKCIKGIGLGYDIMEGLLLQYLSEGTEL